MLRRRAALAAVQARVYDDKVREFVTKTGIENIGRRLVNSKEGKVRRSHPHTHMDLPWYPLLVCSNGVLPPMPQSWAD